MKTIVNDMPPDDWHPLYPEHPLQAAKDAAGGPSDATPCSCRLCNPNAWWMVVCAKCGNKRCPHATDHHHDCTNSNKPDQEGSIYCTNSIDMTPAASISEQINHP